MKTIYQLFKKKNFVTPVILLLLFCTTIKSFSNNYYVSLAGSDATGTGSAANPWRTVYKAATSITGTGHIIKISAGTYLETKQIPLPAGISIEGEDVNTTTLQSTLTAVFISMIEAVSPTGTNGNQHITGLKFDGRNLATSWGICIRGRSNFEIYKCIFQNFEDRGIVWDGRADNSIIAPTAAEYATGNIFHDNIMNNCAGNNNDYGRGCVNIGAQKDMLIYNNTITQNQRAATRNGWPIKYWNEGYLDGLKIYNNTLTTQALTQTYNGEDGMWDFAIEFFNTRGLEIYNNTITGSIDLNWNTKGTYTYSAWVHDNTIGFENPTIGRQSGIIMEYNTADAIIEKNIIKNCVDGIVFTPRPGDSITNLMVRNNLVYNLGSNAGAYGHGTGALAGGIYDYSLKNINILNNTFVARSNTSQASSLGVNFQDVNIKGAKNINIRNNIFQGFQESTILITPASRVTASNITHNDLYLNLYNTPLTTWLGTAALSAGNAINNNLSVNPLFAAGSSYTLQATSALIDAGINVGLPYSGIAPDRGYKEASIALPVKLVDFTVHESKGINILEWQTQAELNSSNFIVQRSSNGQDYINLGNVAAAGSSNTMKNYFFTDASPLDGINYYRLIMVDKDNSYEYSKVISIENKTDLLFKIVNASLLTNNKQVSLTVASKENVKVLIKVFDNNGKDILTQTHILQKGLNFITKYTTAASQGIYYVKVFTAEIAVIKKIVSSN